MVFLGLGFRRGFFLDSNDLFRVQDEYAPFLISIVWHFLSFYLSLSTSIRIPSQACFVSAKIAACPATRLAWVSRIVCRWALISWRWFLASEADIRGSGELVKLPGLAPPFLRAITHLTRFTISRMTMRKSTPYTPYWTAGLVVGSITTVAGSPGATEAVRVSLANHALVSVSRWLL